MAKRERLFALPTFPGISVRKVELAPGYEFGKRRGNKVDVFKKATRTQARQKTATVECLCFTGGGGCTLSVLDKVAFCDADENCTDCHMYTRVPGEAFADYLSQAFET